MNDFELKHQTIWYLIVTFFGTIALIVLGGLLQAGWIGTAGLITQQVLTIALVIRYLVLRGRILRGR